MVPKNKPIGQHRPWKRDLDAERILVTKTPANIEGAMWVPVAEVDLKASVGMNTRGDGELIPSERAAQYEADMLQGDEFPMPVFIRKHNEPGFLVGGGMTRSSIAIKLKDDSILAIVLGPMAPEDVELTMLRLNREHGQPISAHAAMAVAVRFAIRNGLGPTRKRKPGQPTFGHVATRYGVPLNALRAAVKARLLRDEMSALHGLDLSRFADDLLGDIVTTLDPVKEAMCRLVADCPKQTRPKWREHFGAITGKPTQEAMLAEAERVRAELCQPRARKPVHQDNGVLYRDYLRKAANKAMDIHSFAGMSGDLQKEIEAEFQRLGKHHFDLKFGERKGLAS